MSDEFFIKLKKIGNTFSRLLKKSFVEYIVHNIQPFATGRLN